MNASSTVLLPGLDGNPDLLDRFTSVAPANRAIQVIPLPDDSDDDYQTLCRKTFSAITATAPVHLIAESFSGPLAILIANRHSDRISKLTLVASFADSPMPLVGRILPWSWLTQYPMPHWLARYYFTGGDSVVANQLINAIEKTSPATLAQRIRLVQNVDVRTELSELACPVHYIQPTHDRLISRRCVNRLMSTNPDVRLDRVKGSHLILQTRPEAVWQVIEAQFSR